MREKSKRPEYPKLWCDGCEVVCEEGKRSFIDIGILLTTIKAILLISRSIAHYMIDITDGISIEQLQ